MEYYSVFSWGVMVVLATGAVYVYRPDLFQKVIPAVQTPLEQIPAGAKKQNKKPKAGTQSNGAQAPSTSARSSKKRKITGPVDKTVTATALNGQLQELPRDEQHDTSDKDFAEQLAKAQAGTKLQPKAQQKGNLAPGTTANALRPKPSEDKLSTADVSSTNGQDADDDLSSIESPRQKPASGKDISDMLEPSAAAPTTLRLTNVSPEDRKQKQKPQQYEQVVSKKKRNEQARREEQKRLNQESERLHEQKKQEQLRRARMAEGSSNQTRANNFVATSQNAWQKKNTNDSSLQHGSPGVPLLDTFEPTSKTQEAVQVQPLANISNGAATSRSANAVKARLGQGTTEALAASGRENGTWTHEVSLSEQEQIDRLRQQQQEHAWEPVTSKKHKKQTRKADTGSETSEPSARPESQSGTSRGQGNGTTVNGAPEPKDGGNRFAPVQAADTTGLQEDEWQA